MAEPTDMYVVKLWYNTANLNPAILIFWGYYLKEITTMQEQNLKKVAILGRPNVGKSSLFNRLARQRDAITSDMSGTTRDVKKRIVTISENRDFEILDTGGIDYTSELFSKVADFSLRAAK